MRMDEIATNFACGGVTLLNLTPFWKLVGNALPKGDGIFSCLRLIIQIPVCRQRIDSPVDGAQREQLARARRQAGLFLFHEIPEQGVLGNNALRQQHGSVPVIL